jgi:hypothetical protein
MDNSFIDKVKTYLFDHIFRQGIGNLLTDKQFIIIDNLFVLGNIPDLRNPKTFADKIQWLKVYGNLEQYTPYVDKFEVRKYITKTIGNKYLIPLLGVWDDIEDINFNELPRQFVMKATHGSSYVFICKDKSTLNIRAIKKTMQLWLNDDFYKKTREIQYKNCKPKIICEKYMEDQSGGLMDYKFFCFNGKPYFIEIHSDRFSDHKINIVDLNFKSHSLKSTSYQESKSIVKPKNSKEMIHIAKRLSNGFPFVRVDLYSVHNVLYFGELTFTPANGYKLFDPSIEDYHLGNLVDLSKYHSAGSPAHDV